MPRGSIPGERRGGRAPGTPNRATVEVADKLAALNFDPIAAMVAIATDPGADLALRGRMASDLAQFVHPRRKAVEHAGDGGGPMVVQIVNFCEIDD